MADVLKEFLVSLGWSVDEASRAKAQALTDSTEATITKAAQKALKERQRAEDLAIAARIEANAKSGDELTAEEKSTADRLIKTTQQREARQLQIEADAEKKRRDRRVAVFKELSSFALGAAGLAAKITLAIGGSVAAVSTAAIYSASQAAKSLDEINFRSQRIGASPGNISAFAYASSQFGSNAQTANQTLEDFGTKLRLYPGYRQGLERLGVRTQDEHGNIRDTADILTDFGGALNQFKGKYGYTAAIAQANAYDVPEIQARAGMNNGFKDQYQQLNRDQAQIGVDPKAAAQAGTLFEQSMRRVSAAFESIALKIQTTLINVLQPALVKFGQYLVDNGAALSDLVVNVVKAIADVISAIAGTATIKEFMIKLHDGLESLAGYVRSDGFKKDVKGFIADIAALARSIRSALEYLGIIPSSKPSSADDMTHPDDNPAYVHQQNYGTLGAATQRYHQDQYGNLSSKHKDEDRKAAADMKASSILGGKFKEGNSSSDKLAKESYDFWREKGYGHYAALAMVAQEAAETGFRPRPGDYVNGKPTAWGSFQMHADRAQAVLEGTGIDVKDPNLTHRQQLEASLYDGTKGLRAGFFARLDKKQSRDEATDFATVVYEGPKNKDREIPVRRANAAYYDGGGTFKKTEPDTPASAPVPSAQPSPPTNHPAYSQSFQLPPGGYWVGNTAVDKNGNSIPSDLPPSSPPTDKKLPQNANANLRRRAAGATWAKMRHRLSEPLPDTSLNIPLGVSPSLQHNVDNSQKRGDVNVSHTQTFNITGGDASANLSAARLSASRGQQDVLRNVQGALA